VWLARALPLVAVALPLVAVALAGPVALEPPAGAVDAVPVLTSTPFAAAPGQPVTHTVALSGTGTGTLAAVRLTFTTTVGLDSVVATPSTGTCPIVTALTVVCDLGDQAFPNDAAPKVTITGTVHPGTSPGTLVQNLVTLTAGGPDADPSNNVVSNAYLVGGAGGAPAGAAASPPGLAPTPSGRAAVKPGGARVAAPLAGLLALGAVAAAAVVTAWRLLLRRRRRA
jgi:hypothetical protein